MAEMFIIQVDFLAFCSIKSFLFSNHIFILSIRSVHFFPLISRLFPSPLLFPSLSAFLFSFPLMNSLPFWEMSGESRNSAIVCNVQVVQINSSWIVIRSFREEKRLKWLYKSNTYCVSYNDPKKKLFEMRGQYSNMATKYYDYWINLTTVWSWEPSGVFTIIYVYGSLPRFLYSYF